MDPKTTSVWSWDQFTGVVVKHTMEGNISQGRLSGGRGTTLLHVDTTTDQERLCFVNNPF